MSLKFERTWKMLQCDFTAIMPARCQHEPHSLCSHPCAFKDGGCVRRTGQQCDASLSGTMRGACCGSVIIVTVIVNLHTHARTHTHSLTGVELHPATAVCTLWRARAAFVNSTNMHKHTHYSLLLESFNYMNHWEEHRLFKIMPDTPLEQFIYSEYED